MWVTSSFGKTKDPVVNRDTVTNFPVSRLVNGVVVLGLLIIGGWQAQGLFSHSVRIRRAWPQAAQLSVHFFLGNLKNQQCCTSLRDLIMDAPMVERQERKERRKSPAPSGNQTRDLFIHCWMCYPLSYYYSPLAHFYCLEEPQIKKQAYCSSAFPRMSFDESGGLWQ